MSGAVYIWLAAIIVFLLVEAGTVALVSIWFAGGALLAMIAERTAIPMAVISVAVVLLVCIVLGKVFCAWACPVHFMSRGRKKTCY